MKTEENNWSQKYPAGNGKSNGHVEAKANGTDKSAAGAAASAHEASQGTGTPASDGKRRKLHSVLANVLQFAKDAKTQAKGRSNVSGSSSAAVVGDREGVDGEEKEETPGGGGREVHQYNKYTNSDKDEEDVVDLTGE